MSKVVNLNRFRKARAKDEQVQQAESNRVHYGRKKSEKKTLELERSERALDGKKLT